MTEGLRRKYTFKLINPWLQIIIKPIKMKTAVFSLFLGFIALHINVCSGQSMWDFGTVPFGLPCTKVGLSNETWFLSTHCMTYNGTVGCFEGMCKCNQQDSKMYFDIPSQRCLGRVGAYCSAEHSTVFHDKQCTPNADCIPIQGEGYSVGKCECLYGFRPGPMGGCEADPDVSESDRSTPRPTTTTQPPAREEFKLPPISLAPHYATFGGSCQPEFLLNRTVCDTHSRTVSCQNKECLCNMNEDSIFDEELDMCVGLVGTWCLARGSALGYKVCVQNADCIVEKDNLFDDGYSFGTCECVYGYKDDEDGNGTCVRDGDIPNPSTPRTIISTIITTPAPSTEETTVTSSASIDPSAGPTATLPGSTETTPATSSEGEGDGDSAAYLANPGHLTTSAIAFIFMIYRFL